MPRQTRSLESYFQTIPDNRRGAGRRYNQAKMLTAFVIAIIGGAKGFREVARFLQNNIDDLKKYLGWDRDATPGHEKLRTFIHGLDFDEVNAVFNQWVTDNIRLNPHDRPALDGKALRSTLTEVHTSQQEFISIVSAFSHQTGLIMQQGVHGNKQRSEHATVMEIISNLKTQGPVLTMDALHCQKKSEEN